MASTIPEIDLSELAKEAMIARDLLPEFSDQIQCELQAIKKPALPNHRLIPDLRDKLWCSIDNDNSKDLDQLTFAEKGENGFFKIYVAIADVDALVKKGSAIDLHARHNTTSIYTPTKVFSMIPEKLSNDFTSLNENQDRMVIVTEIIIHTDGSMESFNIYPAYVRNHAKLAYNSVAAWLDQKGEIPPAIQKVPGLAEQIQLQDSVALLLRESRQTRGMLTLETIETEAILEHNLVIDIRATLKNRAKNLIEDFMIVANSATAHFLHGKKVPSLRRVVRIPKRWDRIMALAQQFGDSLPEDPDAKALNHFLIKRKKADQLRFPDLSLAIVKLLGSGEYIVQNGGEEPIGHFSLAIRDYSHSTAPNRRYPDLITQRILKALLSGNPIPYTVPELKGLATRCTEKEDDADKVTRQMRKSAACFLLSSKIGQTFDALVTGASFKGTWVRIMEPPVEGKLVATVQGLDVGDRLQVKLIRVDILKGFIDFVPA
jgi:exoribonuclease II